MLRAVLNISKTAHATNKSVYEGIPRVSQKIAARRMKLAGHCQRHKELLAWQTGVVGTNVQASIERTTHTNIRRGCTRAMQEPRTPVN